MDLKVAFVIVCLCALAITSTKAGIPKCCIKTKTHIPKQVLMNVQRWNMQQSTGACDIPALILHVKNMSRPICAHPKWLEVVLSRQQKMKHKKRRATY
ncbi:C-C motif chemokine 28 [Collichthys lucidus]|uniref:C-C motif chemokine 28 n=1 Tax=Collichthys lucidus TaxID=240159 RepID=A0A4U5UTH5_COLLU|nr:C-C motif chemokine 28 [Collichthys lucidus]